MDYVDQVNFEKLKDLRKFKFKQLADSQKKVSWMIDRDRVEFLCQFDSIISAWKGSLPNLRAIFRPEEIEFLLCHSILAYNRNGKRVVEFVIDCGYKDVPDVDKDGKPLLRRTTALHRAVRTRLSRDVVKSLFNVYNRFDLNYTDEYGLSHFHVACQYGCDDVIRKFLRLGQDADIRGGCWYQLTANAKVVKLLLRYGADLNRVTYEGLTPSGIEALRMFFARYPVNVQDDSGNSLLHIAVKNIDKRMAEFMIRNGADPNLTNENGWTPLHFISRGYEDNDDLMKIFFKVYEEKKQMVRIDAQDRWGRTPLHLALHCCCTKKFELLLRRGANPNLADEEGATPLHIICGRRCHTFCVNHDNLAKLLFEICDDKQQSVQVDALDKAGRTPLQLAVANIKPYLVDLILDQGADLSSFALANYFPEGLDSKHSDSFKLRLAAGAMATVKSLEKRGYELDLSDALKVMQLFIKIAQDKSSYGLFEKTENLKTCWYDDQEFASKAKKIMIIPDASLYDLIRLQPREVAKLLTSKNYIELSKSEALCDLPVYYQQACLECLGEKISRRFFRRWAADSLFEMMIQYPMPILCCEIIIDKLTNEDLYNICLGNTIQSS